MSSEKWSSVNWGSALIMSSKIKVPERWLANSLLWAPNWNTKALNWFFFNISCPIVHMGSNTRPKSINFLVKSYQTLNEFYQNSRLKRAVLVKNWDTKVLNWFFFNISCLHSPYGQYTQDPNYSSNHIKI